MAVYHGIVVDASQKDQSIFNNLKVLNVKQAGNWVLYKIEEDEMRLDRLLKELQSNLVKGFYFHFYDNTNLMVVFSDKVFRIKADKSTWSEALSYGKSLGIPEEQLDFFPCTFEQETY